MRSSSFLPAALLAAALPLRVLFLETRSAMSTLASVVSLGSPGSTEASAALSEELLLPRWRLLGGCCELLESALRWPCEGAPEDSGAVVSPSSPDASRDSAWSWASMADCTLFASARSGEDAAAAAARLRLLPPWVVLGDDMVLVVAADMAVDVAVVVALGQMLQAAWERCCEKLLCLWCAALLRHKYRTTLDARIEGLGRMGG